jgi:protein-L-isoaspartate(D-aspartate) O-methyltransferase
MSTSPNQRLSDPYYFARQRMLSNLRARGIKDELVLKAMASVPRHEFVESALANKAYGDFPLPIPGGQTISQPYMVARMTELLEVTKKDRVLEIGAGSGYQTAVLAQVAGMLWSIERIDELARLARLRMRQFGIDNVYLRCGDGTLGWPEYAPYKGILVAAGAPEVPQALAEQLEVGGNLVIPVGSTSEQKLVRVRRTKTGFVTEYHDNVTFVKLIGQQGWTE